MRRALTYKQKLFIKEYAKNKGNGTVAAMKSYNVNNKVTAGAVAYELLNKPQIQQAIEKNLPDDLLLEVHRDGFNATKIVFDPDGKRIDAKDYATRHRYLETGYKLRGLLKDAGTTNNTLNIITEAQQKAIAARILKGK